MDGAIAGQISKLPGVSSVTSISREITQINGKQAHAAFEEALMCTDRTAAFANLQKNLPSVGDYKQAM